MTAKADDSGTCGKNLTWTYTKATKTLTISGTGQMTDYDENTGEMPWWIDNNYNIIKVSIEEGVTSIGDYAFIDCNNLTSVDIPNSVTRIGNAAFSGCSGLKSIEIPNSVTNIGHLAFSGTAWYNKQQNGLIYAGRVAYEYKGKMPEKTSIVLKDNTTGIACNAFYNCTGLTSVEIPNNVTNIGEEAFYGCTGLSSVTIGNSVTSIGQLAFADCSGLTSVTIPNSVTSIGLSAFNGCI